MNSCTRTLSTDAALRLVADRRRRTALRYLIERGDGTATVEELADAIVSDPSGVDGEDVTVREVSVELRHVHLPKLAEHGVVSYDARSGTARYRPDDRVEALVGFVSGTLEP